MTHIWQGLRSGEWLTATRARSYSLILLGICTVAAVGWVMLSDGLTDLNGKPIGTDFSSFYAAGSMALEGHAANAYDMAAHYARQQQIFGASTPYYAWFYPPFLLFIAALLMLTRQPLLSGTLFGLLAYKPQFALVIPIALLASNQWRAIAAAAATIMALSVLSVATFGTEIWYAFAASTDMSRKLLLQNGDVGFEKLQSMFAVVRMWGGGLPLAYIAQGAISIAAVCGVAWDR